MSGIMGIYNLNGSSVDRDCLEIMLETLAHRGPDGADMWLEGSLGFGHRMLWTTPESLAEKLPCVDSTGNFLITADARIDNRDELTPVLDLPNRPIEKITDSEFILAAYKKWGESCPEHLLGDFAFAIWDKSEQKLFCTRDHFGVKPFYYYHRQNKAFIFASEIKALFATKQVPRRLDEVRMGDYLALMMQDQTITSYKDILRLPPAHSMVISQSGVKLWSYWSLDAKVEIHHNSNRAYAEEFCKIFTESVRCRLRSAYPVISHLSGGLDSSAVTCVARKLLKEEKSNNIHTISSIFDNIEECDERPFINAVLEQGGCIPHYVSGDEFGPLSNLDMIFQYEDEALLGPSHFYPWIINRKIKELGMRISLDGFDGDTTVCHGNTRLTELARQGKWKTFIQEAKAVSQHHEDITAFMVFRSRGLPYLKNLAIQWRWISFALAVQLIYKHFGVSRKLLIIHHGVKPVLEQIRQFLRLRPKKSEILTPTISDVPLVNPSFAQSINLNERIQTLEVSTRTPLTVREEHYNGLTQGILAYTLEQMDQYAAMFSLEARHPFMDKRLIEFCLALPSEQKLYQGWGRMVMRRALDGILPEKVQWRGGKTDLSPNFDDGFLKRDRKLLDEVMSHQIKNIEKYVDMNFLQAAYERLTSEGSEIANDDCMAVWQGAVLALWIEYKKVMA